MAITSSLAMLHLVAQHLEVLGRPPVGGWRLGALRYIMCPCGLLQQPVICEQLPVREGVQGNKGCAAALPGAACCGLVGLAAAKAAAPKAAGWATVLGGLLLALLAGLLYQRLCRTGD